MPNDIARLPPTAAADSTQPLPSSVARALRQAEDDAHPDIPWRPPAVLPPAEALQAALALLTPRPAADRTIAACLAALVIAFEPNTRLSPEATRLRFEVWKDANGDLGDGLWNEATARAIRTLKWMPKPAELRGLVGPMLEARALRRKRCERMLAELERRRRAPPPPPIEPLEVRLATVVALYRKHGLTADAERVQRELDQLTGRRAAS